MFRKTKITKQDCNRDDSIIKYQCPKCNRQFWGLKKINLICEVCHCKCAPLLEQSNQNN